jgi:hypothetical protein
MWQLWPKFSEYVGFGRGDTIRPWSHSEVEWYDPQTRVAPGPKPDPADFAPLPLIDVAEDIQDIVKTYGEKLEVAREQARDDARSRLMENKARANSLRAAQAAAAWQPPAYDALMRLCTGDAANGPMDWVCEHGLLGLSTDRPMSEDEWRSYGETSDDLLSAGRDFAIRAAALGALTADSEASDSARAIDEFSAVTLSGHGIQVVPRIDRGADGTPRLVVGLVTRSLLSTYYGMLLLDLAAGVVSVRTCECERVFCAKPSSGVQYCSTRCKDRFKKRRQRAQH